jgi:hypothetical protein
MRPTFTLSDESETQSGGDKTVRERVKTASGGDQTGEWIAIAQRHECEKLSRPGIIFELKNRYQSRSAERGDATQCAANQPAHVRFPTRLIGNPNALRGEPWPKIISGLEAAYLKFCLNRQR